MDFWLYPLLAIVIFVPLSEFSKAFADGCGSFEAEIGFKG